MDCQESQNMMAAYVDDELEAQDAAQYAAHLADCAACSAAYEEMLALRNTIRTHGMQYRAPSHLRHKIQSALPQPVPRKKKREASRFNFNLPWAWINFGVAAAFTFAFAMTFSLYMGVPSEDEREQMEVVSSHARSLMVEHLSDVISTDQHTVKPWFTGKLDFSPAVYDFAQQGFPLIGGRLDYLDQRPVAAMAYHRKLHVINLFVWPDTKERDFPRKSASRQGYQMIYWTQANMHYWVISDVNMQDLGEFQQLLSAKIQNEKM